MSDDEIARMDIPKPIQDFAVWFGMQFPVAAAVLVAARWVLRWDAEKYAADTKRNDVRYAQLIAEKDVRIAERDARIGELKAEVTELEARLSRRRKTRGDGGGTGP